MSAEETFTDIYDRNEWGHSNRSGYGATPEFAAPAAKAICMLARSFSQIVDAPCGTAEWQAANGFFGANYLGVDVVPAIIEVNRRKYPNRAWMQHDLTKPIKLPFAPETLGICRYAIQHQNYRDGLAIIANLSAVCSHILVTTFPGTRENREVSTGGLFLYNLALPPFSMGQPLLKVCESEVGHEMWLWDTSNRM